eukprot:scaffold86895_cov34-Prasinocladus_malaysianus.AAC.1
MFSVLSILGGAAAFEVRKRVAVTKERKELTELRKDRTQLDILLKDLRKKFGEVLEENEASKKSFEEVQQAALMLGVQCQQLIEQNARMEEEQENLREENSRLRHENEDLTQQVQEASRVDTGDIEELKKELEELRDQVKEVVNDFMDGVLSRENLHARLNGLGVEVKFVENEKATAKPLSADDDAWIMQLRSALEPETARYLTFGAANRVEDSSERAYDSNVPCPRYTSLMPTEQSLRAQQNRLNAVEKDTSVKKALNADQKASRAIAAEDKENTNNKAQSKARRLPASMKAGAGVSFQIGDHSKEARDFMKVLKRLQFVHARWQLQDRKGRAFRQPLGPADKPQWRQNKAFIPEPLPLSELAMSVPSLDDHGPNFGKDILKK